MTTMTDDKNALFVRISIDPRVMVGKPVVRGTRIPVQLVVKLLGVGASVEEILADYPRLTPEDIRACLLFAAEALDGTAILPVHIAAS